MRFAALLLGLASAEAANRTYGIFMGLQYYGPPVSPEIYQKVAAAGRRFPVYVSTCADHNDHNGGAEHRYPGKDPGDGGRIVPICDLGDKEGQLVKEGIGVLRDAGVHVLHYVHTRIGYWPNGTEERCCKCCEDEPYVVSRVANETSNWPADGIFIDNAVANPLWLDYYKAIAGRARQDDPTRAVATNPNCASPYSEKCSPFCTEYGHTSKMCQDCTNPFCSEMGPDFFDLADVHLLSEDFAGGKQDPTFEVQLPFTPTDEHYNKFSMFTYNASASQWKGYIDRARAKGFTKFWVTNAQPGVAVTSFDSLPPYFDEMVDYIDSLNKGG